MACHYVPLVYLFYCPCSNSGSKVLLEDDGPYRRSWKERNTTWAWNHPFCSCKLMWMIQACLQWIATSQAFQWQGGSNSNGTGGFFHGHVHGNGWQIPNRTKHNKRNKDDQNQWSYHPGISTTSSALKNMPHCARDSIGIWTCGKGTAAVQENETWQCPFKTGCLWLTLDISR